MLQQPLPTDKYLSFKKSVHKVWKRGLLLQMHRYLYKTAGIMKIQKNMTSPKETVNLK